MGNDSRARPAAPTSFVIARLLYLTPTASCSCETRAGRCDPVGACMRDTDVDCERFITPRILSCRRRFNCCGTRIWKSCRSSGQPMISLIGPGGAGKSTIGVLVAERLGAPFVDL